MMEALIDGASTKQANNNKNSSSALGQEDPHTVLFPHPAIGRE